VADGKTIYPQVELRSQDNPQVDYRLLGRPWPGAHPPLLWIWVTPRTKDLPKQGSLLQSIGAFAPLLSIIPVVGTVAALAISVASASEAASQQRTYIQQMLTPTAVAFAPQFFPQPFKILLPWDSANQAVQSPWLTPLLNNQFEAQLQELQQQREQALVGQPDTVTLSANPAGTVLNVGASGGGALKGSAAATIGSRTSLPGLPGAPAHLNFAALFAPPARASRAGSPSAPAAGRPGAATAAQAGLGLGLLWLFL
jgi:hypothetical protein